MNFKVILFLLAVVVLFLCVTGAKVKNKNMNKLIKCSVPLVLFVALMLCMSKTVEPYCEYDQVVLGQYTALQLASQTTVNNASPLIDASGAAVDKMGFGSATGPTGWAGSECENNSASYGPTATPTTGSVFTNIDAASQPSTETTRTCWNACEQFAQRATTRDGLNNYEMGTSAVDCIEALDGDDPNWTNWVDDEMKELMDAYITGPPGNRVIARRDLSMGQDMLLTICENMNGVVIDGAEISNSDCVLSGNKDDPLTCANLSTAFETAVQGAASKEGCTDPTATNYNPNATVDDTLCIMPISGCTDSGASNYDPNATVDDGSCITSVPGCMDATASNFNSLATTDDGSCTFGGGAATNTRIEIELVDHLVPDTTGTTGGLMSTRNPTQSGIIFANRANPNQLSGVPTSIKIFRVYVRLTDQQQDVWYIGSGNRPLQFPAIALPNPPGTTNATPSEYTSFLKITDTNANSFPDGYVPMVVGSHCVNSSDGSQVSQTGPTPWAEQSCVSAGHRWDSHEWRDTPAIDWLQRNYMGSPPIAQCIVGGQADLSVTTETDCGRAWSAAAGTFGVWTPAGPVDTSASPYLFGFIGSPLSANQYTTSNLVDTDAYSVLIHPEHNQLAEGNAVDPTDRRVLVAQLALDVEEINQSIQAGAGCYPIQFKLHGNWTPAGQAANQGSLYWEEEITLNPTEMVGNPDTDLASQTSGLTGAIRTGEWCSSTF